MRDLKHLEQIISDHNLTENKGRLELLLDSTEDVIEINLDDRSFGDVALYLFEQGIGQVKCKECNRAYNTDDLQPTTIGFGKTPVDLNVNMKGGIRNLFSHRKRNPSLIGGEGYKCPAGHELIMLITWRT